MTNLEFAQKITFNVTDFEAGPADAP